ncbi:energy-coupling factor transporter transmembrane protein EcfT [Caproiciproducens galactitolivorans]|uniref:Energy-coupling factor transporter transmembrane protein EcfT n=1 Tax=Caproiciproducens galactitolivorans TaxID=642589 RepID=A0A4Z0YG35_9FIRM|nr:energy-coupling factor transporter transmembrane component T [Caproiciproducens galactitolivorans]QEY34838.1 energy-coupling factor transporter transmembrane protein EcfT [Caproiciproducens galactitolivorans]TGJ75912.1 energy-coupling factor transporter transmembrane protein EcfT [Caproiciproducens galactitolivorans]
MIRDITLGQYIPGKSFIHRLDPRVKIIITFVYIVFIFVASNFEGLLTMSVLILGILLLSGVPLSQYFKSLKAILFVVIFTSVLNLFYGSGNVLWSWGGIQITSGGVANAVFVTIRIISLILFSSVLTFTTSPTELTDALERIMKPLKLLHVKVHEIAMMMTIALRFVPTLLEETDKIMSAQKARGADMESGGLMQRIRALIPILIPLFVSSFRRAYDLAMAMECRCYHGGEGRTKMKVLHATSLDAVAVVVSMVVCAAVVACNLYFPAVLH